MSETETKSFADEVREKIDDALDVVEAFAADKLMKVPAIVKAPLEIAVNCAFGTIRTVLSFPDVIGGDED